MHFQDGFGVQCCQECETDPETALRARAAVRHVQRHEQEEGRIIGHRCRQHWNGQGHGAIHEGVGQPHTELSERCGQQGAVCGDRVPVQCRQSVPDSDHPHISGGVHGPEPSRARPGCGREEWQRAAGQAAKGHNVRVVPVVRPGRVCATAQRKNLPETFVG